MAIVDQVKMPARIVSLPRDHRGFPVPWFVDWINGRPYFPAVSPQKLVQAVKQQRCWVCGQKLGRWVTFAVGPMCVVNRISAEPPSHDECARYAAQVCPFLANPRMGRVPVSKAPMPVTDPGGIMVEANPGAVALWSCRDYRPFYPPGGGVLIKMGDPVGGVTWWANGAEADPDTVQARFDEGCARLRRSALELDGPDALPFLEEQIVRARTTAL